MAVRINGTKTSPTGRTLHTTCAFSPGDLIATFTNPLICIPKPHQYRTVCSNCLLPPDSTHPDAKKHRVCSGCHTVAYCSPACQRQDWKRIHNLECRVLKRAAASLKANTPAASGTITDNSAGDDAGGGTSSGASSGAAGGNPETALAGLPSGVRALIQLMLHPDAPTLLEGLQSNAEAFRGDDDDEEGWEDIEFQAYAALRFIFMERGVPRSGFWSGTDDERLNKAVEALCKLQTNSFDRDDPDLEQTGTFLDCTLAMANHSCVPNAVVQFVRRSAVLHALRPLAEGDEVLISYIIPSHPLAERRRALKQYYFTCRCARCTHDLDVYEVCQHTPDLVLKLNCLSVLPDLDLYRNPPIDYQLWHNVDQRKRRDAVFSKLPNLPADVPPAKTREVLQARYKACLPLRSADMWACDPLGEVVADISTYYAVKGFFAWGLAVACTSAVFSDPFQNPEPFRSFRLKRCFAIAKFLAGTASEPEALPSAVSHRVFGRGEFDSLRQLDQITLCQMLLLLIFRHASKANGEGWAILTQTKEMLDDIEQLSGRREITVHIRAWMEDSNTAASKQFFDLAVVKPMMALARMGIKVMDAEFADAVDMCA